MVAVAGWTAGAVAAHAAVPFWLARVPGPTRTTPALRSTGVVAIAAGGALMTWAFAAHYQAAPQGWDVTSRPAPEYLLRAGPYLLCRNPMYLGEAIVWLGWSLFYGRPAVWAGSATLYAGLPVVVRWEERGLIDSFGDDYRTYLAQVPRWLPTRLIWVLARRSRPACASRAG